MILRIVWSCDLVDDPSYDYDGGNNRTLKGRLGWLNNLDTVQVI